VSHRELRVKITINRQLSHRCHQYLWVSRFIGRRPADSGKNKLSAKKDFCLASGGWIVAHERFLSESGLRRGTRVMEHDDDTQTQNIDAKNAVAVNSGFDPGPFSEEFSIRSENSVTHLNNDENVLPPTAHNNPQIKENPPGEQDFNSIIERCRSAIGTMNMVDEKFEYIARNYLVDIGLVVHSPDFEIHDFAERFGDRRATKANIRNPYLFVIRLLGGAKDAQRASNQSLALTYAISICRKEEKDIRHCFETLSIRECLKLYRSEKQVERKEAKTSVNKQVKIEGVPIELLECGIVAVEIDFTEKGGRFVRTFDGLSSI
jgi:hypothetical protein